MITIEGEVEEIIFRNEINGYTIFSIKHGEDLATIVGYMIGIGLGEIIKATGKWVNHPNYGEQFKADLCEKQMPKTESSIIKLLSSGVVKGIREATTKKIVDRFGSETLDIINNQPHRLLEIKGINMQKALSIGQAFQEYANMWDVATFLQEYGISPLFVSKIYKKLGDQAISLVKQNPYRLADEIPGIGFKTADRIALSLGIDPTSEERIASCIIFVLSKAAVEQGHTYLLAEKIQEYVSELLGVNPCLVNDVIISQAVNGKVIIEKGIQADNVFLKSLNQAERSVAKKLIDLSFAKFDDMELNLNFCIADIENEQTISLVDEQKNAVIESMMKGVIVITGGPGTGKTTIVNTIVRLMDKLDLTHVLAAPTGRAAKRLSEATGREAKTIHRLLELGKRGEEDLMLVGQNSSIIDKDVVIIDEASMVDILLMNHLLRSIHNGTRLIMVGDVDQLPPVGPGNVLKDIISSGVIKVVRLTQIFRQASESMIIVNAHKINKGEYPIFNKIDGDFFISRNQTHTQILNTLISICSERLPKNKGYDSFRDIQVLSPTKKGIVGVKNLNIEIQKVLNPETEGKSQKVFSDTVFREGDKVMQVKNNYDLSWKRDDDEGEIGSGVFNGDIGRVVKIKEEENKIIVLYDDRLVEYGSDILDELELAYAITVHKSQGSEFPVIVMPVIGGLTMLATRNLLYTAITRAKEMVVLIGSEQDVRAMIDNFREIKRYSGLMDKLTGMILLNMEGTEMS